MTQFQREYALTPEQRQLITQGNIPLDREGKEMLANIAAQAFGLAVEPAPDFDTVWSSIHANFLAADISPISINSIKTKPTRELYRRLTKIALAEKSGRHQTLRTTRKGDKRRGSSAYELVDITSYEILLESLRELAKGTVEFKLHSHEEVAKIAADYRSKVSSQGWEKQFADDQATWRKEQREDVLQSILPEDKWLEWYDLGVIAYLANYRLNNSKLDVAETVTPNILIDMIFAINGGSNAYHPTSLRITNNYLLNAFYLKQIGGDYAIIYGGRCACFRSH